MYIQENLSTGEVTRYLRSGTNTSFMFTLAEFLNFW